MIFYRIDITFQSELVFQETPEINSITAYQQSKYLTYYNDVLLDMYEGKKVPFILQFATDTPLTLLAYAAYEPQNVIRGVIDVEQDVLDTCGFINLPSEVRHVVYQEITASDYIRALQRYNMNSARLRQFASKRFGVDCFRYDTYGYALSERLIDPDLIVNKKTAKAAMKKLLPDSAMADEINRIFSSKHPRDMYYGIPVHYKISVRSDLIADEMVDLITECLYINKRVLSRRITKIDKLENKKLDKENFSQLIECSQCSVVEIMLTGDVATETEYASQFHQISDMLAEFIKKNSGNILFFFIENTSHPGFSKQLLGKIDDELDIIEINEGVGNAKQASVYFMDLLADSNMQRFYENDVVFDKNRFYSATEVRSEFNKWRKERLKDRVYQAYNQDLVLRIEKNIKRKGTAFDELQSMVGLTEVKHIVTDIIAAYKVQKMRNKYYDSNDTVTKHMIFTGNPGTAKTTVARLLAEIMKETGVLKTGAFIECGRADLVGKYVGWTAQIVKEKFRQAQGGILFIDEAYSLVEDRAGLYGDEAINTIVQEMENKRGDVIVIFAGYPEKMKGFLAKNEGLRSRMAFHVNFPDYNPNELMGILEKILKDKQYTMTPDAKDKALTIFQQVYTQDEYGNGRFVRNLFEQAINRQASRISRLTGEEISREQLFELQAIDLDTNIVKQYEKKSNKQIGFVS